jgi:hypothetical protein
LDRVHQRVVANVPFSKLAELIMKISAHH